MTSAADLIQGAYHKIGIGSDDRNLSGSKVAEALAYLNRLLQSYLTNSLLIEYDTEISFNLAVGQSAYVISKEIGADVNNNMLVNLKHVNLIKNNIRYPVDVVDDRWIFKNQIDITVQKRPIVVFLQNGINKSTLNFVYESDDTYECVVKGKFFRNTLEISDLNNDLVEVPEGNYLFIEYALGRILHHNFPGSNWTQELEKEYLELKQNVESVSDIDVEIETSKALRFNNTRFVTNLNVVI